VASQAPESIWGDSIDLRKIIETLLRQWWIILGVVALAVVSAAIFSFIIRPTIYQSTARAIGPPPDIGSEFGFTAQAYVDIASSTQVLEQTLKQLGLQQTIGELRNQLSFELTNENNLAMSAFAETPEEAFQIADAWSKSYPTQFESLYNRSLDQSNQVATTLKQQLLDKEEELERFNLNSIIPSKELRLAYLLPILASTGADVDIDALFLLETPLQQKSSAHGDGALGGVAPSWDSPFEIYLDMKTRLASSRLIALEAELVDNENKLRDLSFASIPMSKSTVNSLEKLLASEPEFLGLNYASIPMSKSTVNSLEKLLASEPEFLGLKLSNGSPIPNPVYLDLRSRLRVAQLLLSTQESLGLESNDGSPIPNPIYMDIQSELYDAKLRLSTQKSEEQALPNKILDLGLSLDQVRGDLLLFSWENGFAALGQFADREGHANVPSSHLEDGFRLGQWVISQRSRKDSSSLDQINRLEALPSWTWDNLDLSSEHLATNEHYVTKSELISQINEITAEILTHRKFARSLEDEIHQIRPEYGLAIERKKRLVALKSGTNALGPLISIKQPTLPNNPIPTQSVRNITLAMFLGLVIGVGIAILRDFYRTSTSRRSYD
jgi:capsular polysaccharide biosynthesis protein